MGRQPNPPKMQRQRILSLPFQIMQKPEGAGDLILKDLGPLLNLEKLLLLTALARYYMGAGATRIDRKICP